MKMTMTGKYSEWSKTRNWRWNEWKMRARGNKNYQWADEWTREMLLFTIEWKEKGNYMKNEFEGEGLMNGERELAMNGTNW